MMLSMPRRRTTRPWPSSRRSSASNPEGTMNPLRFWLLAGSLLLGCSSPARLEIHGSLHDTMMGGAESAVELSRVSPRDSVGVGALSGLRGEVTMLDGRFWLAYPDG